MADKIFPTDFNDRGKSVDGDKLMIYNSSTGAADEYVLVSKLLEDTNTAIAARVEIGNIVNNLTTTEDGKVLDGRQGKALSDAIGLKADKVSGATNGNFAALDANGNLTDSGKKDADYEAADATILKEADIANNLTTEVAGSVLDATQGKALDDKKVDKVEGSSLLTTEQAAIIAATSGTNTGDQESSDFDIKDLTDSTALRDTWSGKQDALGLTPEDVSNKKSTITNSETDYPNGKAVYDEFALKETIADVKSIQPAIQFYKRVLADSGTVGDRSILAKHFTDKLKSLATTQVLYFPHIGLKERTSGVNKYASKLYDAGLSNLDAAQATEGTQPYIGGFIAPNEMKGLKYVQGQTQTGEIAFTEKSYAATDSWTLTFVIKANKRTAKIMLGAASYLEITATTVVLHNGSAAILSGVHSFDCGKTAIIDCQYNNGVGLIKVNNIPLVTTVQKKIVDFSKIAYASASPFDGTIYFAHLQNERISEFESQQNYSLLRALFPEIEGVNIGNQHWATSNFEGTVTGDGTVIPEVQSATSVEKITDARDREFSEDTGNWNKLEDSTISDGVLNINSTGVKDYIRINIGLQALKLYKITFTIVLTSGSFRVIPGGSFASGFYSTSNTYTVFLRPTTIANGYLYLSGNSFVGTVDNVSCQEVGWADATDIYNSRIAAGDTVAQATAAAAMWCYYDNSPANGAIYGKMYNGYASDLLKSYPPKGFRGILDADLTQLSTYLGATVGKRLKKNGLTWTTDTGTNDSGFSAIAGGYRLADGTFGDINTGSKIWGSPSSAWTLSDTADTFVQGAADKILGCSIRLIRNSPVGADRQIIETGNFTTNIASTAKQIAIPFGYVVKELRVTTTTSVTAIEAKLHNTSGTAVATLITGKACNATSQTFIVTADQPTQLTDPTVRVTATGNTGLMNITAIIEKVL